MTERVEFIDVAKGLGMIFVVIAHTLSSKTLNVSGFFESFHMPLFFFISGYLFNESRYTLHVFLKKRFKQLIVPLIGFSVIIGLINSWVLGIKYLNFILPDTLWFLWVLYLVEVIFFLICIMCVNQWGRCLIIFLSGLWAFFLKDYGNNYLYFPVVFNCILFYGIGNIISRIKKDVVLWPMGGVKMQYLA